MIQRRVLQVCLCIGLLWLSTVVGLTQTETPPDLVLEPGDPIDNDIPLPVASIQSFASIESVNLRHARLTHDFLFTNSGPSDVTRLDIYIAIPPNRDNQSVSNLTFSAPYTLLTDRYGQSIAYFQFGTISSGQYITVSWEGDVEIKAMDYDIDSSRVAGLDQISPDIVSSYTTAESMYRLDSQIIQDAAQVAANGATNPYWIARNVHDFVAKRLTYLNDHRWDDAETVYLQQHGSCSEYTILFIALCRANGLPARYVGGTRHRQQGIYVDTVYHRWAEVYLPPYGWVPVDVTHDDTGGEPIYAYFGALTDERFVTTVSGGNSEYLGWNYHNSYRYYCDSSCPTTSRERSFTWTPYSPELRTIPSSLTGLALPNSADSVIGNFDVISTNGSYDWILDSSPSWLHLNKNSGITPGTVQAMADTTGLGLGPHTGEVVLQFQSLDGNVSVPIEIQIVDEILKIYLPMVTNSSW
ncbi:MAG: transglutaminase domain-containing protein [Chloroflexi bacterium]|nr:transglutaminase domain-containing protein [Chloroflexota bacterium]